MSLVLRDALLATGDRADVRIHGGVIVEVASGLDVGGDEELHDLDGALLLPALCEPHAHLDKAFLADLVTNPTGDLLGAVDAMYAAREAMTVGDTIERSRRAAELLIRNGTTAIRTHSDVTERIGLSSVEALVTVAGELNESADIEIVALVSAPVSGLAGRENLARLRDALDAGAHLVGGAPQLEEDVGGAVRALVDVAADRGVGIDLHLDETLDPDVLGLVDLADYVLATGFAHPVSASHCVSLGALPPERQRCIAERVCEAGIAIIANPHTNLYLQGRQHPTATPRGLTAIDALRAAGVTLAAGGDNLQDPFNPLGRGDPLDVAVLMVLAGHLSPDDAFQTVSAGARRAMALPMAGVVPGAAAELVAVPAVSVRDALAYSPPRRLVVHAGRVVHAPAGATP